MKFLKFLRIFLIPIDVIVLLLGGALFWGRFNPDNPFAQYFKKTEELYNIYTLFDKITEQGLYLLIAGGVIFVLIIILFIVCAVSNKRYENSSEYRIQCRGFEYEYDEDKLTVIAKYGYERNAYGPGIDEVFEALPKMFQCVFNEGYTRILHEFFGIPSQFPFRKQLRQFLFVQVCLILFKLADVHQFYPGMLFLY